MCSLVKSTWCSKGKPSKFWKSVIKGHKFTLWPFEVHLVDIKRVENTIIPVSTSLSWYLYKNYFPIIFGLDQNGLSVICNKTMDNLYKKAWPSFKKENRFGQSNVIFPFVMDASICTRRKYTSTPLKIQGGQGNSTTLVCKNEVDTGLLVGWQTMSRFFAGLKARLLRVLHGHPGPPRDLQHMRRAAARAALWVPICHSASHPIIERTFLTRHLCRSWY